MKKRNTLTICGAGIAGVATAYYLLKSSADLEVILVDKNQPLSFTTSKSGENFRDYWPQPMMRAFISDSIILMNELKAQYGEDSFEMKYSGYNFVTHDAQNTVFGNNYQEGSENYIQEIKDQRQIQQEHPYLDTEIKKILRIKNAGKIDVYAMGSLLLKEAKKLGLQVIEREVLGIDKNSVGFDIHLDNHSSIITQKLVIAAGPFINTIASMLGLEFPISNTLQRKFIITDPLNVIPKNMPFTIYADSQFLDWSAEEAAFFASEVQYKWLLQKFPGGLHIKPETEGIKLGWAFQTQKVIPTWDTPNFEFFPQAVLKGASKFIPALAQYENNIPTPLIEYAGYYTRTEENWPLIGPTEIPQLYVVGALAGYGTMAACAAGKLCATHVLQKTILPSYAEYFSPFRYDNAAIIKEMNAASSDGQL
jgi:glycine/D-amino acid oxidase-like deaminating enzyme